MASIDIHQSLSRRWIGLWRRQGCRGKGGKQYIELSNRYGEPHRFYHTLMHIGACLTEFDSTPELLGNDALEFALWFHDAIYDTHAKDNEERSASLAKAMLASGGLDARFISKVEGLVLTTKHAETPNDADARLMADIDLSILGQEEDVFDRYEHQVRKEYYWVPEEVFVNGRSAILRSFLDRPHIYGTEHFKTKYEARARQNIERSLAALNTRRHHA
jgi:predicted metal-dependent HD superfamily phosphohydrolase